MSIEEKVEQLRSWRRAYYNNTPEVTDEIYDLEEAKVTRLLLRSNSSHPFLAEIGYAPEEGSTWPKFKHPQTMGSLAKATSDNTLAEFNAWYKRDGGKGKSLHLSEKIDGCTVVGIWKAGKLVTLATRGDGVIGSNITANAPHYQNIPRILPIKADFVLRGEAGIRVSDFEKHGTGFKNPRNATSGKLSDTKLDALKQQVTVWWFDVVETSHDGKLDTWEDRFNFLSGELNLPVPSNWTVSVDEMWKLYKEYSDTTRAQLDYWIDGLVVRVMDYQKYQKLGDSGNKPKGAIALKFPARGEITTLLGVEVDRGLQCRFTPVALLDPVEIDGTTIGRASLHNYDFVDRMELCIGDEVEIIKGGDIIPKIIRKVSNGKNRKPILPPSNCDLCSSDLIKTGAYLECNNADCGGRTYGDLMKWVRRLDIMGVGPAKLGEIIEAGIDSPAKLYTAKETELVDAVNSKSIGSKIYRSVHAKKTVPLGVFLSALNIPNLGRSAGGWFADHFKTLDGVLAAKEADLRSVEGIAETAASIVEGLKDKGSLIKSLRELLNITEETEKAAQEGLPLSGLSFCITGKLSSGKKKQEIYDWVVAHGGEAKTSVGKDLTHLIMSDPDSTSSKAEKARKLGITLITEDQLVELVPEDQRQAAAVAEKTPKLKSLFG